MIIFNVILFLLIPLVLNYAFIIWNNYRVFKFSLTLNGRYWPLLPFIGNLYVALFSRNKANTLGIIRYIAKKFGFPISMWYGHKFHYICNNAEEARIVLNHPKCYNKSQTYTDMQYLFKNGLLIAEVDEWKPRRRYLRSAFKTSMLKSYLPVFYRQNYILLEAIKNIGPDQDVSGLFTKYALMNFFLSATGLDEDEMTPEIHKYGEVLEILQDEFVKLFTNPLVSASAWLKIPSGQKLVECIRQGKQTLKKIFAALEEKRRRTSQHVEDQTEMNFYDLLFSYHSEKNGKVDALEEFVLFAGAAVDTTGHTLAFLFTLLGMFPEIQEKLYEEVMSVVADRTINQSDIQDLKYTEAVMSETLRLLPPVPILGRYCSEDINIGTQVVPKGANVLISAYHLHRNPEYWKEPLKFDPNRFMPENIGKIVPGSYVPFSTGPRNCIGRDMAIILIKITVANVIRNYEIKSAHKSIDEFVLTSCLTMKAEYPLDCKFIPRVKNGL